MSVKRILVAGLTGNQGGTESYIMELYRHFDRKKLQMDFLVFQKDIAYSDEIKKLGGRIYYVPLKRRGLLEHYYKLNRIFKCNHYIGLYYQCNRKLISLDAFKFAKKYNVEKRIVHSHNSKQYDVSFWQNIRGKIINLQFDRYVNSCFACSEEAGHWMFENRRFKVIKNSIDTNIFYFNDEVRRKIRKELGMEGKLVVGTIGRLADVKNPEYIVKIFKSLNDLNSNTAFLHIGGGELEEKIQQMIKKLSLQDNYHLLGMINSVSDYLQAMDILILPSKHEGFPIALIEAQATGLRCIVADNITNSCDLTGNLQFLSIEESPGIWAKTILANSKYERICQKDKIIQKGYDIHKTSKLLQDYFLNEPNIRTQEKYK